MTNIVAAAVEDERLIDISRAPPHFMGIKVMSGQYQQALTMLPSTAYGWKEGQAYAYVIDFLDAEQQPVYRIYYQDAASNSPAGLMPEMADSKAVDMTILCTAAFNQVDDYPDAILQ
jgi:hypothetical protein